MFTDAVHARQSADGSAEHFQRVSKGAPTELGADEQAFIQSRSSFYMATVSETGWPYVQHRGGPAGFLKVLGPTTLGFADYRGNRQFVSSGNLDGDDRVSLFLMDYPRRGRLKVLGRARVEAFDEALHADLHVRGEGRAERAVLIDIEALDWNCPKYIEPRFTETEIENMMRPHLDRMSDRIERLEAALAATNPQHPELLA